MNAGELVLALPIVFLLGFGFIYCFYGYVFFKFQVVFSGILFGFALGAFVVHSYFSIRLMWILIGGIVGCLIGGLIFKFLFNLAIFSIGLSAGVLVTPAILSWTSIDQSGQNGILISAIVSIANGLAVIFFQRQLLAVFTSIIGAFALIISFDLIARGQFTLTADNLRLAYLQIIEDFWYLILFLIATGVVVQLRRKAN